MSRAWRAGWLVAVLSCGNAPPPTAPVAPVVQPAPSPAPPRPPEPTATEAPTAAPVETKPRVPPARDCGPVVDPPAETWPTLEGCRVTFEKDRVHARRECTLMMCSEERACCNACGPGSLGLVDEDDQRSLPLSRGGEPLLCRAGRDCNAQSDCAAPPGLAKVTGVLWQEAGTWSLEVEELVHRVGNCARTAVEASVSEDRVRCDATYACPRGREVQVVCEGGRSDHESKCTCEIDGRKVPPKTAYGEPPATCDGALLKCTGQRAR